MTDDRTPNLNLELPHQDNLLLEDVARLRSALNAIDAAIQARQMALGFTPENATNKGQPNGYASLDGGGKVPASQLPSYVDDVLEYDTLALFPGAGEAGKIYVALDTGYTYRWSGSAYAEISKSPGPATASTLGVVKIGSGLSVGLDGTLSALGSGSGSGVPAFNELVLTPTVNGQTVFNPVDGYGVGQIELYLNGVLLIGNGDDYTATDGVQIVLAAGVSVEDSLLLRRWTTADSLPFSAITDKPTTLDGYGITDAVPKAGGVTLTGPLSVPSGASGAQVPQAQETYGPKNGQLAGMRNKIINGAFGINQRGYVSGAATTAGQYNLDRWKVTGTGGITFSTTANKTTVTIPSGQTIQQVIEGLNLQTGTYVLSWEGTAQGRIAGGAYGASGAVTASITGGANTTIEFNAGTVANVQLELGTIATPFEHRPYGAELALCQRYYEITRAYILGYNTAGNSIGSPVYWSEKRVTPSAVYGAELATGNATSRAIDSITKTAARAYVNPVATGPTLYSAEIIVSAEL